MQPNRDSAETANCLDAKAQRLQEITALLPRPLELHWDWLRIKPISTVIRASEDRPPQGWELSKR